MENKLFAVYLGGKHDNGFIEDHDLIFVVAKNKDEAKILAKKKTKIREDVHCDGIVSINNVDGYTIKTIQEGIQENIEYDASYQKL